MVDREETGDLVSQLKARIGDLGAEIESLKQENESLSHAVTEATDAYDEIRHQVDDCKLDHAALERKSQALSHAAWALRELDESWNDTLPPDIQRVSQMGLWSIVHGALGEGYA